MNFKLHLILFMCSWNYYGDFVRSDEEIELSTGEECLRECRKNETRKFCHYEFTLEAYPTLNKACRFCKPDINQGLLNKPTCECILVDGIERTVFSVNRMLPGPHIQVCKDDFIIVDVTNKILGTEATLHWHGIFQNGYQYYDGVPFVTQCPINQFESFRYQFHLKQSGTYFWHSHVGVQRLDGLYGPLIIREDPEDDPHSELYDIDDPAHVILISDWLHQLSMERFPGLLKDQGQTAKNILINGRGSFKMNNGTSTNIELARFIVEKGKRYRFRLINSFTTDCLSKFSIENHELLIIAQDGGNVEPITVNTIITGPGERVDFIINATNNAQSYWIHVKALGDCASDKVQQLAILQYQGESEEELSSKPEYDDDFKQGILYNPLDASCRGVRNDTICTSDLKSFHEIDSDLLNVEPDIRFVFPFYFYFFESFGDLDILYSANRSDYLPFLVPIGGNTLLGLVDDVIFRSAPAPPLTQSEGYEYYCNGWKSPICKNRTGSVPCICTNIKSIPLNSVVEVILYDEVPELNLSHPFHLHGYKFQLFDMGRFTNKRIIRRNDIQTVIDEHDKRLSNGFYDLHQPPKDTVSVPQGGWVIFRFKATNPGIWIFHCHFDYHHSTGMEVLFKVGEAEDLPPIPPKFPQCGNFKPPIDFHE